MSNKFKIPNTIYLQCHDDDGALFDVDDEEVTWCEDDVDGHNIRYIREDAVLTTNDDEKLICSSIDTCDYHYDAGNRACVDCPIRTA